MDAKDPPSGLQANQVNKEQPPTTSENGYLDVWPSNEGIRALRVSPTASITSSRGSWNGRGGRDGYRGQRGSSGRQSNNGASARRSGLPPVNSDDWRTWSELSIRILNLPIDVPLRDLYNAFRGHGNITSLDIFENTLGARSGTGIVRFRPVPATPFWATPTHPVKYVKKAPAQPETQQQGAPPTARPPARDGESIFVEAVARCRLEVLPPRAIENRVPSPANSRIMYPAQCSLQPTSMEFGVMLGESEMMTMKHLPCIEAEDSTPGHRIEVDLFRKEVRFFFIITHDRDRDPFNTLYRFTIRFANMKTLLRTKSEDGSWALVLSLPHPPRYFWKRADAAVTMPDKAIHWAEKDRWYRAISILDRCELVGQMAAAYHTEYDDPNYIDLGRWTTFRFTFAPTTKPDPALAALCDFNIPTQDVAGFRLTAGRPPVVWTLLDQASAKAAASTSALDLLAGAADDVGQLDFEVRYHLEACISRRIINEHLITRELLSKLGSLRLKEARGRLAFYLDSKMAVDDPMEIFEDPDAALYFPLLRVPTTCTVIRKATVTPTTIHFGLPTVEMENRVLRHYRHLRDRFMRVQFVDETYEGRISSAADKEHNDEVFRRVWNTLTHGIRVGGRVYRFLAFGNSQIRECSSYFFCETDHVSCDDIRRWMGNFKHIRNVAKHASRLGQCFSTTWAIRGVHVPEIKPIPDVEKAGFCFTDGVGKMSKFVAGMVMEEMKMQFTAAQFRMGGCKGVLAMWPDTKGIEVHVRPSQEKFKALYNGLEVIRGARFSAATLNRQTITILSGLGVPDSAFLELLDRQLKDYNEAMTDNEKAIELLKFCVDENQHTLVIRDMIEDGFLHPDVDEPFVKTLLNLWKIWSLKLLKEKARIVVKQGAFVMGCADETATLRGHSTRTEGSGSKNVGDLPQIFLQISDPDVRGGFRVVTGVCIVGRNPSLHPGDIRVVEAVDVPQLRHLRDVVVFPLTGDRDVPSMLSGGDLDGDDYFVMWDPRLLPEEWHYRPMHGSPKKPQELDRDVDVQDIAEFFVRYMKSDILPQVALAHLANSDASGDGVKNWKSLQLAQLHSKAVDYVKTGEPVELPRWLVPRKWPHFMEKKNSYRSQKALGQIYDRVVSVEFGKFRPVYDNFDQRILRAYSLTDGMLEKAREIKTQYDRSMRRLMAQRDIATEFEFWSGFALSRPMVGSDYKLQEALGQEGSTLKWAFRKMVYEEVGGSTFDKVGPFVAAMYRVTAEEVRIATDEQQREREKQGILEPTKQDVRIMPLISFPWIFHQFLGRIATGGKKVQKLVKEEGVGSGDVDPSTAKAEVSQHGHDGPEAGGVEVGALEVSVLEADGLVSRLNDGRVIHRGEVLDIFHTNPDEEDGADLGPEEGSQQPQHFATTVPLYEDDEPVKSGSDGSSSTKSEEFAEVRSPLDTGMHTPLTEVEGQLRGVDDDEEDDQQDDEDYVDGDNGGGDDDDNNKTDDFDDDSRTNDNANDKTEDKTKDKANDNSGDKDCLIDFANDKIEDQKDTAGVDQPEQVKVEAKGESAMDLLMGLLG